MEVVRRRIEYYETQGGYQPFREWLDAQEERVSAAVDYRLAKVRRGLLGDVKSVGNGVFELRIDFGPGYRIYFGQRWGHLVLILSAGDKSCQEKDIDRAKEYWSDYLQRSSL
jgi:putative addiction module killer protein